MKFLSPQFLQRLAAIALLGALLFFVDLAALRRCFASLTPGIIGYLLLVSALLIYISALKWQLFIDLFAEHVSALRLSMMYLIGYFVNLLLPSHVGGDVARSWYVGKKVGQHQALTATILERFTGMVAMIGLALVFVWFVDQVTLEIKFAVVAMALGLAGATVAARSQRLLDLLKSFPFMRPLVAHLAKIQEGFRFAQAHRGLMTRAMALSLLYHCSTVINTMASAYAVGWYNPPVGELFVVLPIILLVGSLPLTPSGLGLQEGAFVFFLTGLGATPEQALGVGIVLRAKAYLLALLGGAVWYWEQRRGAIRRPNAGASE